MMDGRVKTLHQGFWWSVCLRDNPEHLKAATDHDIEMIDLVVVNLYPFEDTVARANVTFEEAVEQIDIGGLHVTECGKKSSRCYCGLRPSDYNKVIESIGSGADNIEFRKNWLQKCLLEQRPMMNLQFVTIS